MFNISLFCGANRTLFLLCWYSHSFTVTIRRVLMLTIRQVRISRDGKLPSIHLSY